VRLCVASSPHLQRSLSWDPVGSTGSSLLGFRFFFALCFEALGGQTRGGGLERHQIHLAGVGNSWKEPVLCWISQRKCKRDLCALSRAKSRRSPIPNAVHAETPALLFGPLATHPIQNRWYRCEKCTAQPPATRGHHTLPSRQPTRT